MKTMDQTAKRRMEGKDVYVGVDVHKESWQVTERAEGEEILNCRIPGQYPSLKKLLDRYQCCRIKVAYEAGPFGFWLSDKLIGDGIDTLLFRPRSYLSNRETG
jgi:hypothetical protein